MEKTKKCEICGEVKPITDFSKSYKHRCKACVAEMTRNSRHINGHHAATLIIDELKLIMGFPEDYELIGTQADQKKFIGNAVEVTIARKWCEALCAELRRYKTKKTA